MSTSSNPNSLNCEQVLTRGTINAAVWSVRRCDAPPKPSSTLFTVFDPGATLLLADVGDISTRTYTHVAYHLWARAIQLRWDITDVNPSMPRATASVPTGAGYSDVSYGGLSSGARAGIAVGVTLVVLLIIGLLVFYILLHRRRRLLPKTGTQPTAYMVGNDPDLHTVQASPDGVVVQSGSVPAPALMKHDPAVVQAVPMPSGAMSAPGLLVAGNLVREDPSVAQGEGAQKNGRLSKRVEGQKVSSVAAGTAESNVVPQNTPSTALLGIPTTSSWSPEDESISSARSNQDRLSVLLARQQQVRREADRLRELQRLEAEDQQLQEEIERLRGGSQNG